MPHPRQNPSSSERKPIRKTCAYCSHTFETKDSRQNACPNCTALLEFTSAATVETISP